MKRAILIIGSIIVLCISFYAGYSCAKQTIKPQIITQIEYVDRIVEVPVIEEKIVEKIVEKPLKLREFNSLDELKDWLPQLIIPDGDCDDYALALVEWAHEDGYEMSTQINPIPNQINGWHMLNSTIIGNEIYFIKPQNRGVWLWGYRD